MSNAAVINATNSSGQTAGSPITIETGGDVVLKLYGTGSGAWSLTAAFAPVVDGVTGSPITLTINEQTPAAKTSITKTGATQWVGWIMQANGIWEASGLVEGYTGDEALSDRIGTFPSVAALPTKAVKTGTRATVGTSEIAWTGSAWEEVGGGITNVIKGPLSRLAAAKNRGASNPARIAIWGDSNVAGQGAGTSTGNLFGAREKCFAVKMAKKLGWQTGSFFGDQRTSLMSVTLEQYDPRVALGSWVAGTAQKVFGGGLLTCTGPSSTDMTFTPESAFDRFRIWYVKNTTLGNIVIKLDGNVVGTINEAGAAGYTYTEYSCSLGVHTISVQSIAGAGVDVFVGGVETRDSSSSAPIFLHGGYCGAKWADLMTKTNPWDSFNSLKAVLPDCVMTHATINDAVAATTLSTVIFNTSEATRLLNVANSDVIHTVSFPFNANAAFDGTLDLYANGLRRLATATGGSYADARDVFGNCWAYVNSNGYAYDGNHLLESGQDLERDLFYKLFA